MIRMLRQEPCDSNAFAVCLGSHCHNSNTVELESQCCKRFAVRLELLGSHLNVCKTWKARRKHLDFELTSKTIGNSGTKFGANCSNWEEQAIVAVVWILKKRHLMLLKNSIHSNSFVHNFNRGSYCLQFCPHSRKSF